MNSTAFFPNVGSTSIASKPGAVGPLRLRPLAARPFIMAKSLSSVGFTVTRSFSRNVYGTMSSDALMPKK